MVVEEEEEFTTGKQRRNLLNFVSIEYASVVVWTVERFTHGKRHHGRQPAFHKQELPGIVSVSAGSHFIIFIYITSRTCHLDSVVVLEIELR